MNMEIDSICDKMNSVSLEYSLNKKLIEDLNLIMAEIIKQNTYNLDIYELCVSCGHSLTWDHEYTISSQDILWLENKGRIYFYENLNLYIKVTDTASYNLVMEMYDKLLELFKLQIE